MEINTYSTWLEIDLNAIRSNVALIQQKTGKEVMAVIKANGYGHGAIPSAQAAVKGGATWCGVARIEEALALRKAGISCKIMVLGYTPPAKVIEAIEQRITVAIIDTDLTAEYLKYANLNGNRLDAHIKVETGMGRLGMLPGQVPDFLRSLKGSNIDVSGIFTHFPRADEPRSRDTLAQLKTFKSLLKQLEADGLKPRIVHAANSAAMLNFPGSWFDLVRPGNAIFGLHPSPETHLPGDFLPALQWKARITSLRLTPPGRGISYGSMYRTTHDERIGVIPIGYGDGFRRVDKQEVLVHGKRAKVIGRVCMDQCMLQLDDIPEARVGDEVILLGSQGSGQITAEEIAKRWGTINYEVVCGLADRLPRIYKE